MSELATLEIDGGNSSAKWRVTVAGSAVASARGVIAWEEIPLAAEFRDLVGLGVGSIVFASVASRCKTDSLIALLEASFPLSKLERVTTRPKMGGVEFAYEDCSTLGVDRCLAMVAAYAKAEDGVLVLDCGSAMTADLVDAKGIHVGGYIFPGVSLLKNSLRSGTANVAVEELLGVDVAPGVSTAECVERAVSLMVRSSVVSLLECANSMSISHFYITGGDAQWVSRLAGVDFHLCPELVSDGLVLVADRRLGL